jgi:hypothetical protein
VIGSDDQRQRLAGAHLSAATAHELAASIHDMAAAFMERHGKYRSAERHRTMAAEQRKSSVREHRFVDEYLADEPEPQAVS